MDRSELFCCLGLLVSVVMIFTLGLAVGLHWDSGDAVRKAAIQAGVARWTVDERTGKTGFEWVKPD